MSSTAPASPSSPASAGPAAGFDDLGPSSGASGPTLLMVPGWCGDRTVFSAPAALLAGRRRVVVTDLRGHGGNAHQREDFDSDRQVQDLLDLVGTLDLDRVVPVALSHAGWLALELRRALGPERVPGIVLLDWMVLGPPPGFGDALAGLQSPVAWQEVRRALAGMWTAGVEHGDVLAYVASMGEHGFDHWSRAGREIAAAFSREGTPLGALAALTPPPPTLHLYAQPVDDGYLAAQRNAATDHPWFRVERLEARSHFPTFEVPAEIAAAVEEFTCSLG